MLKLDVVIVSKGDPPYLDLCLKSIKREVNFHRLIFITNNPGNEALTLAKSHNCEIHFESYGSLGKAREYAIKLVDCPWLLFVDDDCVLTTNFMEITKHISGDVGAVEGLDYLMNPKRQLFAEAMESLAKILRKPRRASARAFTGDTLIRTEAVKDIKIPRWLKVYEDQYIRNHIEAKGYKWVKAVDKYYCYHYDFKPPERTLIAGICAKKMGYLETKNAFLNFVKIFPKVIYAWAKTGYFPLVPFQIKFYLYYLIGTLCVTGGCDEIIAIQKSSSSHSSDV